MRVQTTPLVVRWTAERFPVRSNWRRTCDGRARRTLAQLAARIPKDLQRRLKRYCVTHDIAEALRDHLRRRRRR